QPRDLPGGPDSEVVIHQIPAERTAVAAEPLRVIAAAGVQQHTRTSERGGAEEDDPRVYLVQVARGHVHEADTGCSAAVLIEDERVCQSIGAERQTPGGPGCGQGAGERGKVAAGGAPAGALPAVVAGRA